MISCFYAQATARDAAALAETEKRAGSESLAVVKEELQKFVKSVDEAKEATEGGVEQVAEIFSAVVSRGRDLERDFVQTLPTGEFCGPPPPPDLLSLSLMPYETWQLSGNFRVFQRIT
jgi:hypothetical protein